MSTHHPSFIEVRSLDDAKQAIKTIGSDPKSIDIMAPKALLKIIKLEHVVLQDALIIKQDMLSLGGEVAIPKNAFSLKETDADILVMGTVKQLRELVQKLDRHYQRIQTLAQELSLLIRTIT